MNMKKVHVGMIKPVRDGIVSAGKEGGDIVQATLNGKRKKLLPLLTFFCAAIGLAAVSTPATAVQYTYQGETDGLLIQTDTAVSGDIGGMSRIGRVHTTVSNTGEGPEVYSYRTDVGVLPTLIYTDNGQVTRVMPTDMQTAGQRLAIWEGPYNNSATDSSGTPSTLANNGSLGDSPVSGNTCPMTVPETSSCLALFGISLTALGFAGRKFRSR
jgi:hypothetical protein